MRRSRAKIRWKQPLLTLAALTLLLAFDGSGILRVGLGCAVLHECGHALAYRLLWQRWPEIEVSPFGLCLRLGGLPMTNLRELLLAAAGPAAHPRPMPLAATGSPAAIGWWAPAVCCPCPAWTVRKLPRVCCILAGNRVQ